MPAEDLNVDGSADGRCVRGVAHRISDLLIRGNRAYYDLGAEIARVIEDRMWQSWDGDVEYKTFNDWCWDVCGFKQRKASYIAKNYIALHAMNVADDSLYRALRLGWTKLAQVVRVARNEIDMLRWIDRIEDESMSEETLRAEVAIALAPAVDAEGMGDPDTPAEAPAEASSSDRKRIIKYPLTFTNEDDLRIFVKALKLIRQRVNQEMSYGEAAALMATNYLGVAARDDEGGIAVELETLIQSIERTYNVRLQLTTDQPDPRYAEATAAPAPTGDGDTTFDGF